MHEAEHRSSDRGPGRPQGGLAGGGVVNGVDVLCEMLRASLEADLCLIALTDAEASAAKLHVAQSLHLSFANGSMGRSRLGAHTILRPAEGPALYNRAPSSSQRSGSRHRGACLGSSEARQRLAALANLLSLSSLMTVPLGEDDDCIGRVYVGLKTGHFANRDILPLWHGAKHACILIESVRLADRLAKEVASQERRRISRDLHDSAIQPYIGLKLGLEAMRRRLRGTELEDDLDELIKLAGDGIGELRHYVTNLKKAESHKHVASLVAAVRKQARKFAEFSGIEAEVVSEGEIPVSAPLQNEIMHIVREGLSNIRRHTSAERATIHLREAQGHLIVQLINDRGRHAARQRFFPRSIGERARELGGRVTVCQGAGRRTVVAVELPLHGAHP